MMVPEWQIALLIYTANFTWYATFVICTIR